MRPPDRRRPMSGSLRTLQRARVTSTARARAGGTGSASRNAGYPFALRARPRGRSAVSNLIIVLAVVLVAGMVTVAGAVGAAALTTAAAVGALSEGLPDPSQLAEMTFEEPTIVYDRSGKVELGRFQRVQRRVVSYPEIPKLVLDAATTAEDRTFWTNEGIDPSAILSALAENASGESDRGASTITQQLVRARLLPEEDTAPGADRYLRKAKEIIQSLRLTEQFPGEEGKQAVITAYLNEIFYGHDAYGVAAAARIYFGVTDLTKLTPAQAALLAGLPKSPSNFDPYQYAVEQDGKLVVPPTAPPVQRRDYILQNLSTSRWTKLSPADLQQALDEPVVLAGEQPLKFRAAQFTYQVRRQLEPHPGQPRRRRDRRLSRHHDARLAGPAARGEVAERRAHRAEPAVEDIGTAAPVAGHPAERSRLALGAAGQGSAQRGARRARLPDRRRARLRRQRRLLPRCDGVAEVRAQVRRRRRRHASAGFGLEADRVRHRLRAEGADAGLLLLDITTRFGSSWTPRDADSLDRGPVLVRKALQYSLNIPAIRALERVGNEAVAKQAEKIGHPLPGRHGVVPAGRPSGRDRDRRGQAPRPHLGVRGVRQRRRPDAAADDPRDPGRAGPDRLEGAADEGRASPLPADRVPHVGHPPGQHRPVAEPDLGRQARPVQRAARQPPPRGREDRHRERREGPRDVRLPAQAQGRERPGLCGGHLDGQQRPLDAALLGIPRPRSTPLRRCGGPSSAT